jgi:hypothetical protein
MNIALLGFDPDLERVAVAAIADKRHSVQLTCVPERWRESVRRLAPRATEVRDWESLLAATDLDAVLIGRDRPGDVESLKKLAQTGIPLFLIHPVGDPLLALELEMIRSDGQGPLVAHYPGCRHPVWDLLRHWIQQGEAGPLGRVEQLVFERQMNSRDRAAVTFQLARDADIIRVLLGNVSKISAMGPSPDDTSWGNLGVQLAGDAPTLARWSVEPTEGPPAARLVVIGSAGKAVVTMPESPREWALRVNGDVASEQKWPDWNGELAALAALESARAGGVYEPEWPGICRDLEVADTVELSLRRGRMIELHHETVTEEDTFKGVMAALGCLLVMVVPLVLIAAAILGGLLARPNLDNNLNGFAADSPTAAVTLSNAKDRGVPGSDASPNGDGKSASARLTTDGSADPLRISASRPLWPYFLVAPLLVFLALQLLRFVFATKKSKAMGRVAVHSKSTTDF